MTLRKRHFIDSHKASNAAVIAALMALYGTWESPTAWIYLALHGTYGFLWLAKSRLFGDRQWEEPCSAAYGLLIWASLSLYWITPWLIVSRGIEPPPWYLGLCVFLYSVGLFLHFVSDMQKHSSLRLRPKELVTDGLWHHCRNPNYLGELLIYLGFSLLAMHWAPLAVLGAFVAAVWIPNMRRKDRSLARYSEFARWKAQSGLLLPLLLRRASSR